MKDSSEENKGTPRPRQDEKVHHFTEEEWQEVLRKKGFNQVKGKMEGAVVILNPHPELLQKLRDYKEKSKLKKSEVNQPPKNPKD